VIDGHYENWELLAFIEEARDIVDVDAAALHIDTCDVCSAAMREWRSFMSIFFDRDVHEFARRKTTRLLAAHVADAQNVARRIAIEDGAAQYTFATLVDCPIETWVDHLSARPELRTEGLIRRIIREARNEYDRRAVHALKLLAVGVTIANSLSDASAISEHRATLAKERANALRMLSRYPEALESLDEAERFLDDVLVAGAERALIDWARATVLFYMTRYSEALPLVRVASAVLMRFGELPRAQQARLLEAGILYETGEVESALRMYEDLTSYFWSLDDAETTARILADRAECEMRLDRMGIARAHAGRAMRLYEELGKPSEKTRVQWTLAHMLLRQGHTEEALDDLRTVATTFEALGMRAEAGGALLDILEIHVGRREWEDAIPLARHLAGLFTLLETSVHAATAYAYLREAVEAQRVSTELVAYIRTYAGLPDTAEVPFVPPLSSAGG
jgi:tetratricopeptide (TPR) repeat protein